MELDWGHELVGDDAEAFESHAMLGSAWIVGCRRVFDEVCRELHGGAFRGSWAAAGLPNPSS